MPRGQRNPKLKSLPVNFGAPLGSKSAFEWFSVRETLALLGTRLNGPDRLTRCVLVSGEMVLSET